MYLSGRVDVTEKGGCQSTVSQTQPQPPPPQPQAQTTTTVLSSDHYVMSLSSLGFYGIHGFLFLFLKILFIYF